jgi:hypothetical protein
VSTAILAPLALLAIYLQGLLAARRRQVGEAFGDLNRTLAQIRDAHPVGWTRDEVVAQAKLLEARMALYATSSDAPEASLGDAGQDRDEWADFIAELTRREDAVEQHWKQHGDDLCWMDDDRLHAAHGLPPRDHRVGDTKAMRRNCDRFIANRCEGGGPWASYAELEEELRRWKEAACAFVKMFEDDPGPAVNAGRADPADLTAVALHVRGRLQYLRELAEAARAAAHQDAARAGEELQRWRDAGRHVMRVFAPGAPLCCGPNPTPADLTGAAMDAARRIETGHAFAADDWAGAGEDACRTLEVGVPEEPTPGRLRRLAACSLNALKNAQQGLLHWQNTAQAAMTHLGHHDAEAKCGDTLVAVAEAAEGEIKDLRRKLTAAAGEAESLGRRLRKFEQEEKGRADQARKVLDEWKTPRSVTLFPQPAPPIVYPQPQAVPVAVYARFNCVDRVRIVSAGILVAAANRYEAEGKAAQILRRSLPAHEGWTDHRVMVVQGKVLDADDVFKTTDPLDS